jgi:hypothetical protein
MDDVANLQTQVIALRVAVEGLWLSLLSSDPEAVENAARMRKENVAAIDQLDASTDNARALRDAVRGHTDHLWGSIEWQLQQLRDKT